MIKLGRKENSIDAASFVLTFERPFEARELESFPLLQMELKDELPAFTQTPIINLVVQADGSASTKQSMVGGGGVLQRFGPDGKPEWVLKIDAHSVVVNSHNYKGWTEASGLAIKYLVAVLKFLSSSSNNKIANISLQFVDKFIEDSIKEYNIDNYFVNECVYVTARVRQAGEFWHVFQGWFEDFSLPDSRLLCVVNLSTAETDGVHVTTIDNIQQVQFKMPRNFLDFADNENRLTAIFGDLHDKNKEFLQKLLVKERLRQIGMEG